MTKCPEIIDFKQFLELKLNNGEIIQLTTKYLTSPGDNYGSVMLITTVEFAKNEPKCMQIIVKIPPISSEWFKIFQIEKTFVKELGIYTNVLPSLYNFQNEFNVNNFNIYDIFPHYYGGRLSLKDDTEFADNNAILLMENLNLKGYKTGNRNKGFNEDETKFVLKNLAILHAITIAIRRLKPDEFNKNIKPYLRKIDIDSSIEPEQQKQMNDLLINELDTIEEFKEIREKTLKQIDICTNWQRTTEYISKETPYISMVHNDLWVNNLMLAYDAKDNVVNGVKFVDFQLTICDSFAHDLLFLLLTSVENQLIVNHLDDLIQYYYENFFDILKQFNCHLNDYTFESFLHEITVQAPMEFFHILYMIRVVMANKDIIPAFEETTNSDFFLDKNLIGPDYYEKLKFIINLYKKKNWI